MKEAEYYKKLENQMVQCILCPHFCVIKPDEKGKCRSRQNVDGKLYATNFGNTMSISIDPMEKKPLYHFYPVSPILSLGPNSCNLSCQFCQNYQSSQQTVPTRKIAPEEIVQICRKHNCNFVAFTYTEPFTWFEFVLDAAKVLQENNIKVVLVSNGFINQKPLLELLPHIDALNIDLKSMDDEFYKEICGGRLEPVLETIRTAADHCHVEVTNLLITDENDSEENIQKLTDFMASVNPEIPVHFSRYYPTYKMTNSATSIEILERAKKIAEKKLSFVYLGNIMTDRTTYCPKCGVKLIDRSYATKCEIIKGKCPTCGKEIYGEFD
ncbi:MAG: AmmeMemoRadiSam system radical SAM enzyme [Candidatus Cloacimonetes bacterium]|nr:AmmeMemoRadiSam system radical SAM enzyme [Candidatus Cloacimonadota bacterium]MCF7814103.1 AmmeMemoRadiSam system radical SAM enzyme [Candidatus Cloacimonadota bacterium]MCF7867968.1 AmmeMemoRadiSam system radical SAM enzyme [Candidatus Cloacimonadota bacterium]MCF7883426.1 AmmeMemoRadiSam system radical SAM enzyme [Candidatus Cloacimonadota bacterium]